MLPLILSLPVLLVIVLFALSNPQSVRLGLWPTDFAVQTPLSLAVLGLALVFFLGGALVAWGGTLSARRRARRAEAAARQLTNQIEALKARLPSIAALPPPGE